MPATWPQLALDQIGPNYADIAAAILAAFAGDDLTPDAIAGICDQAYNGSAFAHQAVTPLKHLEPRTWLLELFHGPTLAFKDIALRLIAALWDHVLQERGERRCAIVATSGDTGGAAVDALAGARHVDLVALHPAGRITEVQRRFMTTATAGNIHNIAVDGDFDAAQAVVKALFTDQAFASEVALSAVNSINWVRIAAQAAYYVATCRELGQPVQFVVPTGNFGDALAGLVAQRLGARVAGVRVAVNANDVLAQGLAGGAFCAGQSHPTLSPAMDIQVPSNFERLVFEAARRDGDRVRAFQAALHTPEGASLTLEEREQIAAMGLSAAPVGVGDGLTAEMMKLALRRWGEVVCPHTAVGLEALHDDALANSPHPVVVLATAHPAKFPETVRAVLGIDPALPERVGDLYGRPERMTALPCAAEPIKEHIRACLKVRA